MLPHSYSIEKVLKNKTDRKSASQSLFLKEIYMPFCAAEKWWKSR